MTRFFTYDATNGASCSGMVRDNVLTNEAMTMPGPGAGDTLLTKNFGHENVGLLIFGHLIDQYLISVKFGH